jgi:uncharacterized protein YaeQ
VFIEHPPKNSMASFNFTSTVLDEGTTFIFGFWICIANGSMGFNSHLANSKEPEASSLTPSSNLDDFIDNLDEMLFTDLAQQIEIMSIFNATSTNGAQIYSGRIQIDLKRPHDLSVFYRLPTEGYTQDGKFR